MRPLTFGILVSAGFSGEKSPSSAFGDHPRGTPERPSRTLDGGLDLPSGREIAAGLACLGHRPELVYVDDDLDLVLRQTEIDACLLALHGTVGGTGDVQAHLTMRGIPFAGPTAATTALAFDKVRCRQLLAYHNLPVPAAVALGPDREVSERALGLLGWPCVLKPRRGSLGVGVSHVRRAEDVPLAVERALAMDRELVLERVVHGPEIQVVLLGERVLGAMQVDRAGPADDEQRCEMMCPPQLGRARLDGIYHLARRAVAALGLEESLTRVDMIVGDRHNEVVLEVEPLPPLHREGVVARVARAAGFSHEAIVAELVGRVSLGAIHERGVELEPTAVMLQ